MHHHWPETKYTCLLPTQLYYWINIIIKRVCANFNIQNLLYIIFTKVYDKFALDLSASSASVDGDGDGAGLMAFEYFWKTSRAAQSNTNWRGHHHHHHRRGVLHTVERESVYQHPPPSSPELAYYIVYKRQGEKREIHIDWPLSLTISRKLWPQYPIVYPRCRSAVILATSLGLSLSLSNPTPSKKYVY